MNCRVSVVVPVFNRSSSLVKCLGAIFDEIRKGDPSQIEVIVVDDGSTEDILTAIKAFQVRYIRLDANSGPAAARNVGAKMARGETILFLDSDVLLSSGALSRILADFDRKGIIGAVQGNYSEEPLYDNFFTRYKNTLLHYYFRRNQGEYIPGFATFCVAVRRDELLRSGGFNESYRGATFEDEELGIKLFSSGGKILLDNDVQVIHMKRHNIINLLRQDFVNAYFKSVSTVRNRFYSMDMIKGSHLAIDYLLAISVSNIIVWLIFLGALTGLPVIGKLIFFCMLLYVSLMLGFYLFVLRKGFLFLISTFLFSFIDSFVISIAILYGLFMGCCDVLSSPSSKVEGGD